MGMPPIPIQTNILLPGIKRTHKNRASADYVVLLAKTVEFISVDTSIHQTAPFLVEI